MLTIARRQLLALIAVALLTLMSAVPPTDAVAQPGPQPGGMVTIELDNCPLGEALSNLARQQHLNIACGFPLSQTVTVHLENVPVMTALSVMLDCADLQFRTVMNPGQRGADILIIEQKKSRIPELEDALLTVPAALEFEPVLAQVRLFASRSATIVASQQCRLIYLSDTSMSVGRIRNWIDTLAKNVPASGDGDSRR
ncbi:MAG: hypothetical protein AB7K09_22795 [Planctomycetota bacterium]